jgi:hypothetical protein
VALIDHDALAEPGARSGAVWRGWMMTAAQYGALADALGATRAC